ncbi:hypothetical protein [Burkholderia gladioli]|uniref:hypothetical protein n=1 Tax=Burkholderia gladioli TaxID=28095 RepID=UPI00163FE153|nr:hypothetical protein [Burkholderia gladioli]
MSKYTKLDALILAEIGIDPVAFHVLQHRPKIEAETIAIADASPRNVWGDKVTAFRILDRRLQALRKAGKIRASTKGWTLAARDGGGS